MFEEELKKQIVILMSIIVLFFTLPLVLSLAVGFITPIFFTVLYYKVVKDDKEISKLIRLFFTIFIPFITFVNIFMLFKINFFSFTFVVIKWYYLKIFF